MSSGPKHKDNLDDDVDGVIDFAHLEFTCQACEAAEKHYFIRLHFRDAGWEGGEPIGQKHEQISVLSTKVGEYPGFVPTYPKPLLSRLDDGSRRLFFKGIKCENNGCGIGSLAYYRRIVEDTKRAILDKLIEFGLSGALSTEVASLREAQAERQFAKAVELARQGINEFAYRECCADLLLLHDNTSAEMHAGSDEDAAETAREIRDLLLGVIRRLDQLKDDHNAEKRAREALRKRTASRKAE